MSFRGYSCSRSRRAERRKELQAEYAVNAGLKAAVHGEQEEEAKRPVLSLSRKRIGRVEKAISVRSTPVYDSADNTCLPNSSIYSAKYRKSGTLLESGEVTARA